MAATSCSPGYRAYGVARRTACRARPARSAGLLRRLPESATASIAALRKRFAEAGAASWNGTALERALHGDLPGC